MRGIFIILGLIILVIILLLYYQTNYYYYQSDTGIVYKVVDYPDRNEAAKLIDQVNLYLIEVMRQLKKDIEKDYDFGKRKYFVDNIIKNYDPTLIKENPPTNSDTAYVINKGDEFVLCLRDKQTKQLHDLDILKFVALHELTHIGSIEMGHEHEFWGNFSWFLKYLNKAGLYQPTDYKKEPVIYCGLKVSNNPFYVDID